MIILSSRAKQKYSEFTSALAKEMSQGAKNSPMLDFISIIHDKYKVVQLYPSLGKDAGQGVRKIGLSLGWHMLYRTGENFVEVIDFARD